MDELDEIAAIRVELAAIDAKMDQIKSLYDSSFFAIPRLERRLDAIASRLQAVPFDAQTPGYEQSIATLCLPKRAENSLKNDFIETIGQLARRNDEELLRLPNFGRKSLNDVKEALASRGLKRA